MLVLHLGVEEYRAGEAERESLEEEASKTECADDERFWPVEEHGDVGVYVVARRRW